MKTPLVTIGMPVYNGAPYVAKALDALLAQDYPRLEILVSDNASTDDTPRICEERARRDPRLSYLRNDVNTGAMANFRRVLSLAHGDYFMWAAHDDLWEPRFISSLASCFQMDADLVFAMSHYDRFSHVSEERGTVPAEGYPAISRSKDRFENCVAYLRKGSSELIYGLFRADVLRRTRFSTGRMFDWGDVSLINEIATMGRMHIVPEVLFHTGFVGPRPLKSLARWRLPGLEMEYGPYFLRSAGTFLRAQALQPWQRAYALWLLTVQCASMVYTNELPPVVKKRLDRLWAAARRRRPSPFV